MFRSMTQWHNAKLIYLIKLLLYVSKKYSRIFVNKCHVVQWPLGMLPCYRKLLELWCNDMMTIARMSTTNDMIEHCIIAIAPSHYSCHTITSSHCCIIVIVLSHHSFIIIVLMRHCTIDPNLDGAMMRSSELHGPFWIPCPH